MFGFLDSLQHEIAVNRHVERLLERAREVTYRESALAREACESDVSIKALPHQLGNLASLPWSEPVLKTLWLNRDAVGGDKMCAEHPDEAVHKELAADVRTTQERQDKPGKVMQYCVHATLSTRQALDARQLTVVGKGVQRRAGQMVMDAVESTRIAPNRIRLQIVDPYASRGPQRHERVRPIDPHLIPKILGWV